MDFRIVERVFSEDETMPTIMVANIYGAPDVQRNLDKMEKIINIAHEKRANILIFPELTVTGYVWDCNNRNEVRSLLKEGENTRIASWIKNVRDSLTEGSDGLEYIFYGNSRLKEGKMYNSTFILNRELDYSAEEYIYAKVFLTPVEQDYFSQGTDKRLSIDTKWGRFGFMLCYDLCFVELARQYAFLDGADAIVTMAAWHSEAVREYTMMNARTDHYYGFLWDLMNSSKAAYNQVWSLGSNWVGLHEKSREYLWGGSGMWAPSGMKLLQASNINEELLIVRNLDIKGQRDKEQDDFNYRIDFEQFYRNMAYGKECIYYVETEKS
ncbi:MAG: carbon-nitrogen hydrolase family protein [Bacillota bacterium]